MARERARRARSAKALASGVKKGFFETIKEKIMGKGRDFEEATPKQTEEEKFIALIDQAIENNEVEQLKRNLQILESVEGLYIDKDNEFYDEEIFNQNQSLKAKIEFIDKHVERRAIEQRLENSNETIKRIIEKRNEATEKIKNLLVMSNILDNREDIIKYTNLFIEAANDCKTLMGKCEDDITRYKELTGIEYQGAFDKLYFDEDMLDVVLYTIPTTINLLEEQIALPDKTEDEKNKLGNIKNTLMKYLSNSVVFVRDPKEVERIIPGASVNPKPKTEEKTDDYDQLVEEFKASIEKTISLDYKEKEKALLNLETQIIMPFNLDEDDEKFKVIPEEEKKKIKATIEENISLKFYAKYSKKMVDYVFDTLAPKLNELKKEIEVLRALNENFYAKCDDVEKMIYEIEKDIKANKLHKNIMISFDEDSKRLKISFKPNKESGIIEVYENVILNEIALDEVRPLSASEKNNLEKELEEEFAKLFGELFTIRCQQIETLTNQKEKMSIQQRKIKDLVDATGEYSRFARIPKETRDTKETEARKNYSTELKKKYGLGLRGGIETIIIPAKEKIENELVELLQADYNDEKYNTKYPIVRGYINELIARINQPELKGLGIKVEFDENREKLTISFENKNIKTYESQILNDKALSEKKKGKKGPEVTPTPTEKGKGKGKGESSEKGDKPVTSVSETGAKEAKPKSAIIEPKNFDGYEEYKDLYIATLEYTNDLKRAITASNATIATSSDASFVLNTANMEKVIKEEKKASEISSEILKKELVLSDIRYKVRSKYGKSILLDEKIKNIKEEKVYFGPEAYAEYVTARNNTIISAEEQLIIKHNEIKNTSDISKKQELLKERQMLLDYIEAQNSAVSRRIVAESLGNPSLNVTQLFEKRNAEMKETRARIRAIALDKEEVERKPVIKPVDPLSSAPDEPTIKVKTTSLNMKKIQKISPELATMFEQQDAIKVVIAKNTVQIKINKQLREALSKFNAKIGLINKATHGHKYGEINPEQEEQEFNLGEGQEINPEDYYIRIRAGKDKLADYELEGKVRGL